MIVVGIGPPLLAGLFCVLKATREYWALPFALWPIFFPFGFTYFMNQMLGPLVQLVFQAEIAADEAHVERLRQERAELHSRQTK